MTAEGRPPAAPISVRGTVLSSGDSPERRRDKIARITLDSMVQFVGLLDVEGNVLEINHVALDAVGVTLAEVEGRPFWTTFWWQVSPEINAELRASIERAAAGEFVRYDAEIFGRAGGAETIIIDASLTPVFDDDNKVVFITAEGRDITEKKAYEREIARQREELAQLDELKTQFFANISHEFRTPLTLMMGPLEDLLSSRRYDSAEAERNLQTAYRNSLRLQRLVNALLDFSRIEAGRIEAVYEGVDLAVLTADLASMFRAAVERAGLRYTVDCAPIAGEVYVDRDMWEKVVLNLLSNALKFTFAGEIRVSLTEREGQAELTVSDTGTGIADDERAHVFERFHRVRDARSRTFEGSGIGLSLVQELARIHGGDVSVESRYGEGSTFRVRIPLGKHHLPADRIGAERTLVSTALGAAPFVEEALRWLPHEGDAAVGSAAVQPAETPTESDEDSSATILVVDDNADMRDYVARLLAPRWSVIAVADGEAALQTALRRDVDLVLSDVMMPGLDGFALLRALRSNEKTAALPVILLSARAGEEARVEGLEADANDYLTKPFSARELLSRVNLHLSLAASRKSAEDERQRLYELFMQTPAPISVLRGRNLVHEFANPPYHRLFPERSLVGKPLLEALPEFEGNGLGDLLITVMESGRSVTRSETKVPIAPGDGTDPEPRYFSFTYTPLEHSDGTVDAVIVFGSEVTDQVVARAAAEDAAKALEETLALREQFVSLVSHELRTPLSIVLGNALLLQRRIDNLPEDVRAQSFDDLVAGSRKLQQIIENLLLLTRVTGPDSIELLVVQLRRIIDHAVGDARRRHPERQVRIHAEDDHIAVVGESGLLGEVLENLLSNAIKYSPAAETIDIFVTKQTDEQWMVSVEDRGPGLEAHELEQVFQPFYRSSSAKNTIDGIGLGLSVCRRILEAHGGRIWAENREGGGIAFRFVLVAHD